ncbi:Uncharacterised protein [Mycobacteroides abscessus subsp. abscessus]|nr:Uncharacterised protein [Mycobacteroides abscessus subsp. abscessus]
MPSRIGTPWRVSAKPTGPVLDWRSRTVAQAYAVSFASPGRTTERLGMARRAARCSTGWWVGPSSPRPIESCVQT